MSRPLGLRTKHGSDRLTIRWKAATRSGYGVTTVSSGNISKSLALKV
jgi:hypothetical protein